MLYALVPPHANSELLTIYQVRALFDNISWPDEPDSAALGAVGLVAVEEVTQPQSTDLITHVGEIVTTEFGGWRQEWIQIPQTLEYAKIASLAALESWRYDVETGGCEFSWDETTVVTVHTDRESQAKINAAWSMVLAGYWQDGKKWKFKDGVFLPMSGVQVVALTLTVASHVGACYEREAQLASQIVAAVVAAECEWSW